MILVDTNVFSETTKPRPDHRVVEWLFRHRDETLLSTIVVAELAVGIRVTREKQKRALFFLWLECLVADHAERILPFDLSHAVRWGEFAAEVLIAEQRVGSRQFDTLLAAQAMALGVPLATRNVSDFESLDIRLIDPWTA